MKLKRRTLSVWALVGLLTFATFSAGCEPAHWFGSGLNVNVVVPMGLGGTPGLLNPFGIVQAIVNSMLGTSSSSGESTSTDDSSSSGSSLPTHIADGSIGVILN